MHSAGRVRPLVGSALLLVVALVASLCAACSSSSAGAEKRPNIVFFLTDDQRWDAMSQLPQLWAQRAQWARFDNMYIEDPECCPSRATILSGRHTQHTRVHTLNDGGKFDPSITMGTMLHDAGYQTALYGKYLNGFPFARRPLVSPGWDDFEANTGKINYYDYTLIENGKEVHYDERYYSTDILTKKSLHFIDHANKNKPMLLYVAYNAPHATDHGPPQPARRDQGKCEHDPFPMPPNFNAHDKHQEPYWMSYARPQNPAIQRYWLQQTCETLLDVDRSVTSIMAEMRKFDRFDNTYFVFMSDNGYGFGEHRLVGKGDLYEESTRVPLWVRGPGVKPGPIARLTSNVDITPTFVDWAHAKAPRGFFDGESFAGNLRGETGTNPSAILLRGCRTSAPQGDTTGVGAQESGTCGAYPEPMGLNWGLRTEQYKYIDSNTLLNGDSLQLFDLKRDPWELDNLAYQPGYQAVVKQLGAELRRMRGS